MDKIQHGPGAYWVKNGQSSVCGSLEAERRHAPWLVYLLASSSSSSFIQKPGKPCSSPTSALLSAVDVSLAASATFHPARSIFHVKMSIHTRHTQVHPSNPCLSLPFPILHPFSSHRLLSPTSCPSRFPAPPPELVPDLDSAAPPHAPYSPFRTNRGIQRLRTSHPLFTAGPLHVALMPFSNARWCRCMALRSGHNRWEPGREEGG